MKKRSAKVSCSAALLLTAIAALSFTGCQTPPGARSVQSPTGGVSFDLMLTKPGGSFAFYQVKTDGSVGFGGGTDALDQRVTFTTQMTDDEIAELTTLMDECGWGERKPQRDGEPEGHSFRLRYFESGLGLGRTYEGKGDSRDIEPVHEFLKRVTARRNEEFLRRLPQSGPQPDWQR